MTAVYNFAAGPAMIACDVMQQAREEFIDWQGTGMSVMEMSHRGKDFMGIAAQANADLRMLLNIPDNYKILWLQGGASTQFGMLPLNLLGARKDADYFCTGAWSKKAIKEAQRFCQVNIVASGESENFTTIPESNTWQFNPDAAYVHYTSNETIQGVQFADMPDVGDKFLVADMSSDILSRRIDVARYGVIYAGAQKNIGPSGLSIVIIREDLLGNVTPNMPSMYDYKIHADNDSMYNTPPTFAWYMAGLTFQWLLKEGGIEAIAQRNQHKAEKLYAAIDMSGFYRNPVAKPYRSRMNVPFILADAKLDARFLEEAARVGLLNLKGHRSVGGMRASIYNAMPEAGIDALIEFMQTFEKEHA